MHHSKSDIFWKCWLWSAIFGVVVASLYAFISDIGPKQLGAGDRFFDVLMAFSIIGAYFGAGLVGWRVADKYYHAYEKSFVKRYIRFSLITLVVLVAIAFSPLSILGLLWSFIAPLCVLWALGPVKKK